MPRYRILGPLEVERDDEVVTFPAAKHRSLLLALLLRRDEVCSTDHLVDALWDRPPASSAKLLQGYISHLRGVLGAGTIETISPGYRLRVEADDLDVCRFDRLHEGARRALDDGNPALAASLAARALALWRGPALADVAYEPFAEREAARLEEARARCVELELDAELATGGHDRIAPELRRLCEENPLRERLHERLALALYRGGRQADALAVLAGLRHRLRDELGLDPGRGARELEQAILTQDPALDPPVGTGASPAPALPRPANALVGREREIAELHALLRRDEVRLVTVSGAGGSGKTRLALEVAATAGTAFANGAFVVELASVADPASVLPAIAKALGLAETAAKPASDVVAEWLATREVLLVVDNFEQVIDAAAALADLVRRAPLVTALVTSRRVLHVTGEHVYPLGPLALDDARRLFALRAAARDPSRVVDEEDAAVLEICTRLDCLPLALEIAAARTAALDLPSMLDRLRVSVGALGPGPRDAPARQQTLADTIRWSTDLLSDAERRALARLSVFVGGCDLAAAEVVSDSDLDVIVALADWNLLRGDGDGGRVRFRMLDTIRHHAAELLDDLGERDAAEAAHAAHLLSIAEATFPVGTSQPDTLIALDPAIDDLRAVYDRAEARGDHTTALRVASALYPYWYVRGLFREGRDRIAAALSAGRPDGVLHAQALRGLASMYYLLGEEERAETTAARGVEIGTQHGALDQVLACHTVRGLVAEVRREFDQAREHILASAAVARALGRELDVIVAETNLGEIALGSGDLDEARRRFETARRWHQRHGTDASFALIGLGAVARRQGRLGDADEHLAEARSLAAAAQRPHTEVLAALAQAGVAADRGDLETAGRLLGWVDAVADVVMGGLNGTELDDYRRIEAAAITQLDPDRLAELLAEGRDAAGAGWVEPTS